MNSKELVHELISYAGNHMANPLDMLAATKQARSLVAQVMGNTEQECLKLFLNSLWEEIRVRFQSNNDTSQETTKQKKSPREQKPRSKSNCH